MMREHARDLILRFGWNSTSYQILNPGFNLWSSSDGTAVAGYVNYHGVRVVGGVPVCEPSRLDMAVSEFELDARGAGQQVAWFGVEERALQIPSLLTFPACTGPAVVLPIGVQPVWHPSQLATRISSHPSLRAQLNRASAKGVAVHEWSTTRAQGSDELQRVLADWLHRRALPPLHFLVESQTLANLGDRRTFVAMQHGRAIGFLIASPVPLRRGWLVEQNIRASNAPNGTTESLLHAAAAALARDGYEFITLGLSPLSAHTPTSDCQPPRAVRTLFAWMRVHGKRFYNFEGLDQYKAKFRPERWEPVYAVVPSGRDTWRALIAVTAAFAGGPLLPFTGAVMQHALEHELERVKMWRTEGAPAPDVRAAQRGD